MALLLRLAWRNLLRNRRRTLLTSSIMSFGLAALILTDGLIIGMMQLLASSSTDLFLGHAQIHHPEFLEEQKVEWVIPQEQVVLQRLEQSEQVAAYAPRSMGFAMVATARDSGSAMVYGIDPEREIRVSQVKDALIAGEYLSSGSRHILLGYELADSLQAQLNDRVVVTGAQAHSGELAQELFRVGGILRFNTRQLDQGAAFIPLAAAQKLFGLDSNIHEIAVRLIDPEDAAQRTGALWSQFAMDGVELKTWQELVPAMRSMLDMTEFSIWITAGILYVLIGLTITNTLFMAIYERMYEFGVLKAVGTRSSMIIRMVLTECCLLGLLSAVLGGGLGLGLVGYFSVHGINFGESEIAGLALTKPIMTAFRPTQWTALPLSLLGLSVVVGLYPAMHAARLIPSDVIRKTL